MEFIELLSIIFGQIVNSNEPENAEECADIVLQSVSHVFWNHPKREQSEKFREFLLEAFREQGRFNVKGKQKMEEFNSSFERFLTTVKEFMSIMKDQPDGYDSGEFIGDAGRVVFDGENINNKDLTPQMLCE